MGLGSHIEYPDRLNWLDRSCNTPIQSPRNEELSLETLKKQLQELQVENNRLMYKLNREKQQELEVEINTLTNKLHELKVDLKDISEKLKIANGNKKELVKVMFNEILSTSHLYKTRKSLKLTEIQNLLS